MAIVPNLSIKRTIRLSGIEELYSIFSKYKGANELSLPLSIEDSGKFGVVPALIQFLSTWIRFNKSNVLNTEFDEEAEMKAPLKEFLEDELGFICAALIAKNKTITVNSNNKKNIYGYLKDNYEEYLNKMRDTSINLKGERLFLTCFDHLGDKGKLPQFYSNPNEFNKQKDIENFLHSKLENEVLMNVPKSTKKPIDETIENIASIVFELMENTHNWGRNDFTLKNWIEPNVRGLYIRFHKLGDGDANISYYTDNHPGLERYFKKYDFKKVNKIIYFLEISVFDSGSGYASIFGKEPIGKVIQKSIKEEVELIKKCLTKRNTSIQSSLGIRGLGLYKLLKAVNNKGFLRIRSGRAALYRDLANTPYNEDEEVNEKIVLYDWKGNTPSSYNKMSWAAGSLITVLYPIDNVQYNQSINSKDV